MSNYWSVYHASKQHFPRLLIIEHQCFGEKRWTLEDLNAVMAQRNGVILTVDQGGEPLGYCAFFLFKRRIELVRLAVQPRWHRQGIARALLNKVECKLHPQGRYAICASVPEELLMAQQVFSHCGYVAYPTGGSTIRFIHFAQSTVTVEGE